MRDLQDSVERVLQEVPVVFLSDLVKKKLLSEGMQVSDDECKRLAGHALRGRVKRFRLKQPSTEANRNIVLSFTSEEIDQLSRRCCDFLDAQLPNLLTSTAEKLAPDVLATLKTKWQSESRLQHKELAGFRRRLYQRWKVPIEKLRMLLTMCRELGDGINSECRKTPDHGCKHLVEVLTRCHARACQISEEILCLLSGGFADGAMARWRTLHEVVVVASLIADGGEALAERYVLHQAVESWRAAGDYQKCCARLGYTRFTEREMKELEKDFNAVVTRFGRSFAGPYGWAADHLRISKPTFAEIEHAVGRDHFRSHYRMASHSVHANPKGVFFKLGLISESPVLLAGPSNAGMADPGHGAALGLGHISATITKLQPTFDHNVALLMISELLDEIGEAFLEAQRRLEIDDARCRRSQIKNVRSAKKTAPRAEASVIQIGFSLCNSHSSSAAPFGKDLVDQRRAGFYILSRAALGPLNATLLGRDSQFTVLDPQNDFISNLNAKRLADCRGNNDATVFVYTQARFLVHATPHSK